MTGSYNPDRYPNQPGWRAYQEYLRRNQRSARRLQWNRGHWLAAGLVTLALTLIGIGFFSGGNERVQEKKKDLHEVAQTIPATPAPATPTLAKPVPAKQHDTRLIKKADVHILLGKTRLINVEAQPVEVTFDGRAYAVRTNLDMELQQYLLDKMDRVNSRYIGIVAMAPDTGRLLAMAGFNKIDPGQNPCLVADYPAASLFKIITAAAAAETKGYTAASRLKFNGYKHTLYKRQLTDKTNRYTNSISFRDSFAQSVNPVFGKIGALYLDRKVLETYGNAFGFNQEVGFELPWGCSHLTVKDGAYERAEIASGFNRRTTMSPLHGAVIVSAIVNAGKPVEPTLVDRIEDAAGNIVYQSQPRFLPPAVSPQTADVLDQLMVATITSGTARKPFRGYTRNKVLSRLNLGGKTGSIYNRDHDERFDWFVGFATEKKGSEKIVVSVMVAHEKYIGIRAGQYARMAIEYYFKDYFTKKDHAGKDSSG